MNSEQLLDFIKKYDELETLEYRENLKNSTAIGDYLHVVSNQAQMVDAAASNDMVIREWIPDPKKTANN